MDEVKELGTTICPSLTVLNQGTCFSFKWSNGSWMIYSNMKKNCENSELTPHFITEAKQLSFLVTATNLQEVLLLHNMLMHSELIHVIRYQRIWTVQMYYEYTVELHKATGYSVCYTKVKKIQLDYNNIFVCSSGESISKLYLCDEINHCLDRINSALASDEKYSTCIAFEKKQRQCSGSNYICSPLHFKSASGKCLMFLSQMSGTKKVDENLDMFTCKDNSTIDMSLLNDMISDCGPTAEDEPILKALLTNGSSVDCPSEGQFPCRSGHSKCYTYDQICIYKLDQLNNLYPCRTGSRIEECKEFECHQHYKCPRFYCIPWTYVCDGKWDCPYGYDEKEEHNCGLQRKCKGMLKCLVAQICVHLYDICNDYPDCSFKDDEDLCELKCATCPQKCVCFYFAMKCEIVTKQLLDLSNSPYAAIHISSFLVSSITFIKDHKFFSVLNMSCNFVAHICVSLNYLYFLKVVDFSWNNLEKLPQGCFQELTFLLRNELQNNKISLIEMRSFMNLGQIYSII